MKRIKNLFLLFCMIASAFLLQGKNVNAEEFKPEIIGTLSKAGDSVKVENVNCDNSKSIKYVSSTDEMMYVYTDAKESTIAIYVLDKNGVQISSYWSMREINGEIIDPAKTGNSGNAEIFIKLKKGEVYYFFTKPLYASDFMDYNVNLIKASKKPEIKVFARNQNKNIDLSEVDLSKEGLTYDKDNYVLTMKNANIPYEIYATAYDSKYKIFAEDLLEVKVLGKNTITTDCFSAFFYSDVSTIFTGDGKLIFKTATKDYRASSIIMLEENMGFETLKIDGPTFETSVDTSSDVISTYRFIMDNGKFIYSGCSNYHVLWAPNYLTINGGEIDCMNAKFHMSCIHGTRLVEINGGTIRVALNCEGETWKKYTNVIGTPNHLIINDGTIVIKYIEPEGKTEYLYCTYMFEAGREISINGGNIYVIVPDKVKGALGDKFAQIIWENEDGTYPDVFISDKANIQKGSTIDISKVECSLEYDKCKYDGKEKKPAVTVNGLVEGTDYTVTYSNNVNPGTAKVTITGKGDFTGKKELTFVIEKPANDAPKIGTRIKDKNYIYKVIKAGSKDGKVGKVSVVGLNKKSLKKIKIATKVTIGGITYKVTSIGAKAFKGNKKITKVTIGKNVKKIGSKAFYNCKKLKNVRINSKKIKKIGKKAFFKKKGKKITFKVPKAKKKAYKKLLKTAKTKKFAVK